MRRTFAFFKFLIIFIYEILLANLSVAYIILFVKKSAIKPAFFTYAVGDLRKSEAIILSHCITLTPGTITAHYDTEKKELIVHSLDYSNPEQVNQRITNKLKNPLLEVTR